jgi:hypothetical protein
MTGRDNGSLVRLTAPVRHLTAQYATGAPSYGRLSTSSQWSATTCSGRALVVSEVQSPGGVVPPASPAHGRRPPHGLAHSERWKPGRWRGERRAPPSTPTVPMMTFGPYTAPRTPGRGENGSFPVAATSQSPTAPQRHDPVGTVRQLSLRHPRSPLPLPTSTPAQRRPAVCAAWGPRSATTPPKLIQRVVLHQARRRRTPETIVHHRQHRLHRQRIPTTTPVHPMGVHQSGSPISTSLSTTSSLSPSRSP